MLGTVSALLSVTPAHAFKPYTHMAAAQPALADVTDDGHVTIDGREYAVRPQVAAALKAWPSYYQAGVIGPDGFPDLTFGQSTIHPKQTGKWVAHLLEQAWAVQDDPAYATRPNERGQILAFAYGYATHAAGDMWAHTFVNDFARGIFPGVGDIVTDVEAAEIALRHIIVEGYMGDATPGYDGNADRQPVGGDVSSDSTPGIAFDAPKEWLYDVLVNPSSPLPVGRCGDGLDDDADGLADDGCAGGAPYTRDDPEPVRGPLIDFFLDLQSDLQLEEAVLEADREREDCSTTVDPDCFDVTRSVTVQTVRGTRTDTFATTRCDANVFCVPSPADAADDLSLTLIAENYLEAWIEDIEDGLEEWGEVGLGSTRALFDAQALRNTQNDECDHLGDEDDQPRISCEDGIGATDVLFHELDPFINDHLLSMLGAPDALGGIREALQAFSGVLDDILGPALNPLRLVTAEIKEKAKELVVEEINKAFGIDIEVLSSFLKHPTYWLDVQGTELDLGPLGTQPVELFGPEDHEKLDELLQLPADHHVNREIKLPDGSTTTSSALSDDATFSDLEVFDNAVTTSKLVLLDAAGLNRVAGDQLAEAGVVTSAAAVGTYSDPAGRPANVMVDGLGGVNWLTTIDGDHVWRENGLPRFGANENPEDPHGGAGTFPLWESCLLRPAFRSLYEDWETDPTYWPKLNDFDIDDPNFPALGDETRADPSDSSAPASSATVGGGPVYDAPDGTHYVGPGSSTTVTATDDVFAPEHVTVQARLYLTGTAPPAWESVPNGTAVPLAGRPDGRYTLETRAGDPCHAVEDAPVSSTQFVLDTTAPVITVTSPAPDGREFDTDDTFPLTWTVDDGPDGSGVATTTATFDGAPAAHGQQVDTFLLDPGSHTVRVTSSDRLGNGATVERRFTVRATSASLLSNVRRACAEGLISDRGACNGLQAKLQSASDSHGRGKHAVEVNQLEATLNQVDAKLGKGIQPVFGARLVAWLEDLIAHH